MRYYVSASASAMYSCLEHLLYDYAKKYWRSFDTRDYLDARYFLLLAKATHNEDALQFIQWYNGLDARIESDKDAAQIWKIRRVETHRGTPPLDFVIEILEPFDIADRLEYGLTLPSGEFQSTGSIPPSQQQLRGAPGSRVTVYFTEYRRKETPDVFESALLLLESILGEADKKFGFP